MKKQTNKQSVEIFLKLNKFKTAKEMCEKLGIKYSSFRMLVLRDKKDDGNRVDKKLLELQLQIYNIKSFIDLKNIIKKG